MLNRGDTVYVYGEYARLDTDRYLISLYGSSSPIFTNSLDDFGIMGNTGRVKATGEVKSNLKNGFVTVEISDGTLVNMLSTWTSIYKYPSNTEDDIWRTLGLVAKMHDNLRDNVFGTHDITEIVDNNTYSDILDKLNELERNISIPITCTEEIEALYQRFIKILKMSIVDIETLTGQYLTYVQLFDKFSQQEILHFITTAKNAVEYAREVNKMYTYIRGFCVGGKLENSLRALSYAREKHKGQKRKDGQPYIVHPLTLASWIVALEIYDDNLIAVALLHDVVEDCGVSLESLPFNDTIKTGVKYMTISPYAGEDKATTKKRYFKELLESKEAVIVKALDRLNNLGDMEGNLSEEAIIKNVKETDELLLPVLKEAKEIYPEYNNTLYIIREMLKIINRTLATMHKVYVKV